MIDIFDQLFFQIEIDGQTFIVFPDQNTDQFRAIYGNGQQVENEEVLGNLFLYVSAIDLSDRLLSQQILDDQVAGLATLIQEIVDLYLVDAAGAALAQVAGGVALTALFGPGTSQVAIN